MLEKISRKQPYLKKAFKHGIFPLLFYLLIFCLLTYPLILKFFTHYFTDTGDGLQNIWNLWWVNTVVLRPNTYPSIWQTNLLHWPFGTTLYGQTLNPFNGYLAVFLLRFLTLTSTFNTITIFTFVMGGVTMYWLAYYLTRSFWGSIIAGFIFTFSSYHFSHVAEHLQLISLEWIPLFILIWYILTVKPGVLTGACAAIVFWLVLLCDYYYFFYIILTAILIVLWYAIFNKKAWFILEKKYIIPLATFLVIAFLLTGPILSSLVISNIRDPLQGFHHPITFSLDLLSLFIPGNHWIFNQWTEFFWSKLPGNINENSVFLPLTVFIIPGYLLAKRKQLELFTKQQILLWLVTAGVFFLLALGPAFHFGGKIIWDKYMPYTLLVHVLPVLNLSGVPVRMMVIVTLSASILSAFGFQELFRQLPKKKVIIFFLLGLILFETLIKPLPTTRIEVPDYVTALAGLPNDGGVVDLVTSGESLPLYYQTIHHKPIVFGYVSRLPKSVGEADLVLAQTIEDQDYGLLWDKYHIRYILTQDLIQPQELPQFISIATVYDKNDIRIYRIGCKCEEDK